MLDIKLTNGLIVDGTGDKAYRGDVGILEGKIAATGDLKDESSKKIIDLDQRVVCPGFIDVHSHQEFVILNRPDDVAKISQGITTDILGNCGISAFPIVPDQIILTKKYIEPVLGSLSRDWDFFDLDSYYNIVEEIGCSTNIATLVGHGNLRIAAMGFADREPTVDEMDKMKALLMEAIEQGALGLSTGLIYAPGCFSKTPELIELAKAMAPYGGSYVTHLRSEGSFLIEAVREAISIATEAHVQLHLSHLKAVGKPNHGKVREVLAMVEAVLDQGIEIYMDRYPYTASSTSINIVLPPWTLDGGIDHLLGCLQDENQRRRIAREIEEGIEGWENRMETIGEENIVIASVQTEANRWAEGLSLKAIAEKLGKSRVDALLDLILEERGVITALFLVATEEDIEVVLKHPRAMVGSDGVPCGGKLHPRLYGSFPRALKMMIRGQNPLSIEEAVRKLTSLPAKAFGLQGVGLLKPGFNADLTVIDMDHLMDEASYSDPTRVSRGIDYVFVSGELVYREGTHTGHLPGRIIRRSLARD